MIILFTVLFVLLVAWADGIYFSIKITKQKMDDIDLLIKKRHWDDSVSDLFPWEKCSLPPKGWYCTRAKGHEGPCAAHLVHTARNLCRKQS